MTSTATAVARSRIAISQALGALLVVDERDHRLVSAALSGRPESDRPADPELGALADDLRALRRLEPDAPAMQLLGELAARHPAAADRHAEWLVAWAAATVPVDLDGARLRRAARRELAYDRAS